MQKVITVIDIETITKIELQTRSQADSKQWMDERCKRMTASKFGTICKATERRDKGALAQSLCERKSIRTAATQHGLKYEKVAVEKFEATEKLTTRECGLYVCKDYPYLAASPDRVIDDDTLLEVKCPYTNRDKEITHLTVPFLVQSEQGLELDQKHDYYYQIQGQMLCSGHKQCKLMVMHLKHFQIIHIPYNQDFVDNTMLPKLKDFFENFFKPGLINYHVNKNYYDYKFE